MAVRAPRLALVIALAVSAAAGLAGCGLLPSSESDAAVNDEVPPPLPTIGLGSDVGDGLVSGGVDVRAIDTGAVDSVLMIGDSITVGAEPALRTLFESLGFSDVVIESQQGKRAAVDSGANPSGATVARFLASGRDGNPASDLWVVALGTNDISQYPTVEDAIAAIDEVLAEIPDEAPLVWINTYFAERPDDTAEVNEAIDRAISARGNATVGNWDLVAPSDGVLRSDGVHPNENGSIVFADLVARTVADFLQ